MTDPKANPDVLPTQTCPDCEGTGRYRDPRYWGTMPGAVTARASSTVSAEPSPNPLREALEFYADRERYDYDVDCCYDGRSDIGALEDGGQRAREALADQSQSDRTSDEATPAEPVYEWRAVSSEGYPAPTGWFTERARAVEWLRRDYDALERRRAAGPAERVDDGGRRR